MDELTPAALLFLHYTDEKSPWFQSALNELKTQRPGKFELDPSGLDRFDAIYIPCSLD